MADQTFPASYDKRQGLGHAPAIYVLGTDQDGPVKIGYSADVIVRVKNLQTGNPLPIQVVGVRLVLPLFMPGGATVNMPKIMRESAMTLEKRAHTQLDKMGLRMMGEWFDVSAAEALAVLEKVALNNRLRSFSREWLLTEAAKSDAEIGWVRDDLLSMAASVEAQATRVNEWGLTFVQSGVMLLTSSEGL